MLLDHDPGPSCPVVDARAAAKDLRLTYVTDQRRGHVQRRGRDLPGAFKREGRQTCRLEWLNRGRDGL